MTRSMRLSRQRGQATAEYLVVAILVTALVAVPIEGSDSALDLMLKAIHTAYTRFLAALSIPM